MTESHLTPPFTRPKVRSLVLHFFLYLLLLIVILVAVLMGGREVGGVDLADPIWVMGSYIVLFTLLSVWLLQQFKRYDIQLSFVLGKRPERYRWLAMSGLILAALVCSLSSFLVMAGLLSYVAPAAVEALLREVEAEANPQTANSLVLQVVSAIAVILVAPIAEELIFRGFMLQRWGVKWNLPLALILSSVVFGLLHLTNPIGLTVFGFLMGVLYIKTRSLIVPIAGHMLNNVIATSLQYLPQNPNPTDLAAIREALPAGIMLLGFSAPWLVWFITKHFPRRDAPIPYVVNAQKSVTNA
ncbi:MAG: CPBP family intramembrane glutamic endopeptidase [Leptolyngbyaceae cyanobacterium bins.349]|nr:CPBP family intramembrane glutamic endopeptidase [Leptolyngbyaceae cyanobacterium bins.349]